MLAALWLPDDRQGWMLATLRRGFRTLTSDHVLFTSAPPFSAHLAGLVLSTLRKCPWVAEFRDPWTDNPAKEAFVRTSWSDAIERALERRCLASASRVIMATSTAAGKVRSRVGRDAEKVLVIRTGVRTTDLTKLPGTYGNGRILYFGNLTMHATRFPSSGPLLPP